jgi:5-methylcytosine-specific restriction endonuclease McrA
LSECEFTEAQKFLIKDARKARKQLQKKSKPQPANPQQPPPRTVASKPATPVQPPAPKPPSLTKLERMLYLQQGKCFFCGEKLALADASIEHLHPLSLGGKRDDDNEVVCHKSLNHTFGDLPLKRKFEFVLKAAGSFSCP